MPRSETDDRLRVRRRALIDPSRFDPSMYGEDYVTLRAEDLQLYALDTSKYIDDLISESYEKSPLLREILDVLGKPDSRYWPTVIQD